MEDHKPALWKPGEYHISNPQGREIIAGQICGQFGIHSGIDGWVIDHMRTGLYIAICSTEAEAKSLAGQLAACGDWNFRSPANRKRKALQPMVKLILARHKTAVAR